MPVTWMEYVWVFGHVYEICTLSLVFIGARPDVLCLPSVLRGGMFGLGWNVCGSRGAGRNQIASRILISPFFESF
jgi:hypothetical protein